MQPFTPHDFAENRRAFRLRHNALISKLAGDRMIAALDRLGELVEKANFNPAQPRAPGGGPGAGQWIYVEGYAQGRQPGIGHNGGPPLELPPDIPKEPPKDARSRLQIAKAAAKWLAQTALRRAGPIGAIVTTLEGAHWLYSEYPSIRSYQDAPKTLSELQQGARETRRGYERHHIVEQGPAIADGFPRTMIDGVDNIVSVPTYKHHEISGWYQKPHADFGGMSPREYLRGKDWETRRNVGYRALREVGVLK